MASSSEHQQQSGAPERSSEHREQSGAPEHFGIGATEHFGTSPNSIPIVEVAFNNDTWWPIPEKLSRELDDHYMSSQDAGYA